MTVVVALTIFTALPYVVATHIFLARHLFTADKYDPNLQLFFDYYTGRFNS